MMSSNLPTRRLLDPFDLIGQEFNRLGRWFENGGSETMLTGVYPVDIREDDNHIYVEAEMPGFKKDEVNITLEDGVLSISAERKPDKTQSNTGNGGQSNKRTDHLTERRFVRIQRSFTLPNRVDEGAVEAKMDNGVLYITLNKREEVKPRRIEVK